MRTSVRIALAGSAVLAGVAFASPAMAADSSYIPAPTGTTTTTVTVTAGQTFTFTAGGFQPGSTVTVKVSDGRSFSVKANSSGEIALSISFENAGTYTITASGVDANGAARTVSTVVTVNSASVVTATANTNNTGGLPFTGLEVGAIAALGAATLVGGATVRVVARRRGTSAA